MNLKESAKQINWFTNILFPAIISFFGVYFAIGWQKSNSKDLERSKEKQYAQSLKSDLSKDLKNIDTILVWADETMDNLTKALAQMQNPMKSVNDIKLNYILTMKCDWFPRKVNFTEGVVSQLKYTGDFRLIHYPDVADSIGGYDVGKTQCQQEAQMVIDAYKETFSTEKYVFNYKDRLDFEAKLRAKNSTEITKLSNDYLMTEMHNNIKMVTTDQAKIIACYNDFAGYQAALESYTDALKAQRIITGNLLTLLNNNYQ